MQKYMRKRDFINPQQTNVRIIIYLQGPLTRYLTLRDVHALGMPGTFSPSLTSKETASYWSRHASRHVYDRYLTMGFLSDSGHVGVVMHAEMADPRWRGKSSRRSWRMRNPQFYVSDKRSIGSICYRISTPWLLSRNDASFILSMIL